MTPRITTTPEDGDLLPQLLDCMRAYRRAFNKDPGRVRLGPSLAERLGRELLEGDFEFDLRELLRQRQREGVPLLQSGDKVLALRVEIESGGTMSRTRTYTVATLEVSGTVWDEVWRGLRTVGHEHRRIPPSDFDGRVGIDMSGIALVRLPPPAVLERPESDPYEPTMLEEGEVERFWQALKRAERLIARQREALYASEKSPDGSVEDADARAEIVGHDETLRLIRECAELLK